MREWGKSHAPTNYLRVRGEYGSTAVVETVHSELPPCARRIHFMNPHAMAGIGTTSACAENTPRRIALTMGTTSACAENTSVCK